MKIPKVVKEKVVAVMPAKETECKVRGTEVWSKVPSKKRKERRRIRPEVIVISKNAGAAYANILSKLSRIQSLGI